MPKQLSRRQASLALLAATGYIFAKPEPASSQSQSVMRTLRFPLDGFDALQYTYKGKTISFTPQEIFDVLGVGK